MEDHYPSLRFLQTPGPQCVNHGFQQGEGRPPPYASSPRMHNVPPSICPKYAPQYAPKTINTHHTVTPGLPRPVPEQKGTVFTFLLIFLCWLTSDATLKCKTSRHDFMLPGWHTDVKRGQWSNSMWIFRVESPFMVKSRAKSVIVCILSVILFLLSFSGEEKSL